MKFGPFRFKPFRFGLWLLIVLVTAFGMLFAAYRQHQAALAFKPVRTRILWDGHLDEAPSWGTGCGDARSHRYRIVTSREEWAHIWTALSDRSAPQVDFGKEFVYVALGTMGERLTPVGYENGYGKRLNFSFELRYQPNTPITCKCWLIPADLKEQDGQPVDWMIASQPKWQSENDGGPGYVHPYALE